MGSTTPWRWLIRSFTVASLMVFGLLVPVGPASAVTFTVTENDDSGDGVCDATCTVRDAAESANDNDGVADIISIPAGVFVLGPDMGSDENSNEDGDIDLTDEAGVTVVGAGMNATIVDGNGTMTRERVFDVREGDATFMDLSIRNGDGRYYGQRGGGIFYHASGLLTVQRASVHKNDAYRGGGIGVGNGDATIEDSEIADNTADDEGDGDGGGIYVDDGVLVLRSSSVVDNYANDYGGGIKAWGWAVTIENSTISGNSVTEGDGGGLWLEPGFGLDRQAGSPVEPIYSITTSTIANNTSAEEGGGLFIECCGLFEMSDSTVNNNAARSGGGIFNDNSLDLVLAEEAAVPILLEGAPFENVTVSSNYAYDDGGGIYNNGDMHLNHVTVYRNVAEDDGGGIYDDSCCTVSYQNTIVAGNTFEDCDAGSLLTLGNSLLGDDSCDANGGLDDLFPDGGPNIDPRLGPLRDNGGPTRTHALLSGSPAIDAAEGDPSCPGADQRNVLRPTGATCDIGAYEVGELEEEPEPPQVGGEVIERDLLCRGLAPTILGTGAPDVLVGTPGPDVLQGLSGDDRMRGRGGDDVICGARGDDRLKGNGGDDILKGLRGDDRNNGGAGEDLCIPGPGENKYKKCEAPPQTV